MSYQPKVYKKAGGDELVVASGGKITVEAGGSIENDGDTYVVTEPDDEYLEVNGSDKLTLTAEVIALLDLLADLPTSDQEDGVTIYNDNGVLKVSITG